MAAIVPVSQSTLNLPLSGSGAPFVLTLRNATAQANTGQTDWVVIPQWARIATVDFNLTSVGASTTPLADLTLNSTDPVLMDDTYIYKLRGHAGFTQITAAAHLVVTFGAGVHGASATDDTTTAATGYSDACINTVLPAILGVKLVFDRTTGDEVYTYTLSLALRP
jgi:hypothetical protein